MPEISDAFRTPVGATPPDHTMAPASGTGDRPAAADAAAHAGATGRPLAAGTVSRSRGGRLPRLPLRSRLPWIGGDLQTVRNALRGPVASPPADGARLLLDLADGTGDRLAARLDRPAGSGITGRPLAVLVHGLTGCDGSAYMRSAAAHLLGLGFPVVRLNLRGSPPSAPTSTGQYHAGRSEDFRAALAALARLPETAPLMTDGVVAVGYSLGGNMLLKHLGEAGTDTPVRRAVAVSPPIDLAATCRTVMLPRNAVYHRHLLRRMRAEAGLTLPPDGRAVALRARTTYEFDDLVVAPRNGFGDADTYHALCSAQRWMAGIRIPTLVLHAANDPWIPVDPFDRYDWAATAALTVDITAEGGHVGFHAAGSRTPWSDRRTGSFLLQAPAPQP